MLSFWFGPSQSIPHLRRQYAGDTYEKETANMVQHFFKFFRAKVNSLDDLKNVDKNFVKMYSCNLVIVILVVVIV